MLAALDIGYGAVKIACGGERRTFPSVTGSPDLHRFGLSAADEIIISNHIGRTLIGSAAVEQSRFVRREEDRRWIRSEQYTALYYAALTEISREPAEITLISGLPLAYFDDKDELKEILSGAHRVTREYADGVRSSSYDVQAHIIPQPFGTLCSMAFDKSGSPKDTSWLSGTVGILDVGSHTTNILTTSRGREVPHGTTSVPTGCWDIVRAISARVSELFPQLERRDHDLVNDIIAKRVTYLGREYSIEKAIAEVCTPMAAEIIATASQYWNGGAALDKIVITGGGAHLIGEHVSLHFAQHEQVYIAPDPVFANVDGYLRYGFYLQSQGEV